MRTCLPVRVESLWWMRGLRRLLRSLGTLPLVLDATAILVPNYLCKRSGSLAIFAAIRRASSRVSTLAAERRRGARARVMCGYAKGC